jgi:hypothetical protein
MIRKNEVLTREDNCIPLICRGRTPVQEDYLTITEGEIPMKAIEQTWIFEVGEETRVGRITPKLVNTLVKIIRWVSHVGSGKIDDSCLEARHNIHHNVRINGIRF